MPKTTVEQFGGVQLGLPSTLASCKHGLLVTMSLVEPSFPELEAPCYFAGPWVPALSMSLVCWKHDLHTLALQVLHRRQVVAEVTRV